MRTPIAMDNPAEIDGKSCEIMVFKTSIRTPIEVRFLAGILDNYTGVEEWSVNMEDWEKVLRIKSRGISASEVKAVLKRAGVHSALMASEKIQDAGTFYPRHPIPTLS